MLPTIRARQPEVNATADISGSALLACDADGFPEPTVTWAQYVFVTSQGHSSDLALCFKIQKYIWW